MRLAFAVLLAIAAPLLAAQRAVSPPATSPVRAATPLVPADHLVQRLPDALRAKLATDPYVYFRFINVQWERAACEQFADILPVLPRVRLHGDPHLEQYAFTSSGRGIDDFDDSATGPFVLDLTRFMASIRLALAARGWSADTERATDAFLAGYRLAFRDPQYLPPDPAVVSRLRARRPRSRAEFLAWADGLMLPLAPEYKRWVPAAASVIDAAGRRAMPGAPPGYFTVKKAGRLSLGVGSALTVKALFRLEGSTPRDDDDLMVEAKVAGDLSEVPCLTVVRSPAFRVVRGAEQIGRLHYDLLTVLPRLDPANADRPETWWLRSWEPTYQEVDVADYASADELVEVAHDVGAQLGRGHFDSAGSIPLGEGLQLFDRFEARVRHVAESQTAQMLADWAAFAARTGR